MNQQLEEADDCLNKATPCQLASLITKYRVFAPLFFAPLSFTIAL